MTCGHDSPPEKIHPEESKCWKPGGCRWAQLKSAEMDTSTIATAADFEFGNDLMSLSQKQHSAVDLADEDAPEEDAVHVGEAVAAEEAVPVEDDSHAGGGAPSAKAPETEI